MSKKDRRAGTYEVVDEKIVKETIDLIVDFCESKHMTAKVVMLAMEIIVDKIKAHLQIESVDIQELSKGIH